MGWRSSATCILACLVLACIACTSRREFFEWRRSEGADLDGEQRLRVAVRAALPPSTKSTSDPLAVQSLDVWSEMFEQVHGGQLFVQGSGPAIHSAADVELNPDNPYAQYFLNYGQWADRMRAMAIAAPPGLQDATRGVFCDSYAPLGKPSRLALTVCADADAPHKRVRVREFLRLLEAIALMRQIDERERLANQTLVVSEQARVEAAAHDRKLQSLASESEAKVQRIVTAMDLRMRREQSSHAAAMRELETKAVDVRRKIERLESEVGKVEGEIESARVRLRDGGRGLADAQVQSVQLTSQLSLNRALLEKERLELKRVLAEEIKLDADWRARMDASARVLRSAMVAADEAREREKSLSKKVASAEAERESSLVAAEIERSEGGRAVEKARGLAPLFGDTAARVKELRAERERLIAQNDANAARLAAEMASLGPINGEASVKAVQGAQNAERARALESEKGRAEQNLQQARLEASVRVGKVVNHIDMATVDREAQRVYAKRAHVLARQQALLDAQHAALDETLTTPQKA